MLSNANVTTNNVTIGNRPCIVVAASPVSLTCITPPTANTTTTIAALATGLAVTDPVWANGQKLTVSYSYGAAVTPVLDWLFPTSVATSVTSFVHLTLANVQVL